MKNRIIECWFCHKKAKLIPTANEKWGSWLNVNKIWRYTCIPCSKKVRILLKEFGKTFGDNK